VFPVRYELNSYIVFRRNSVFKGLIIPPSFKFTGKERSSHLVATSVVQSGCIVTIRFPRFEQESEVSRDVPTLSPDDKTLPPLSSRSTNARCFLRNSLFRQ
jgi:hypothetical protein